MEQQQVSLETARNGREFLKCIFQDGVGSLSRLYGDMALQYRAKQELGRLPRFKEEVDETGYIAFIGLEKSTWENEPDVVYLCLYLWSSDKNQGDWWRGSLSANYMTGNNSNKRYIENTLGQLAKIGWQGGENWGAFAQQYINKKIPFWVSENTSRKDETKKFYRIACLGESGVRVGECLAMPGFGVAAQQQPAQQQPAQQRPPQQQPVGGYGAPAQQQVGGQYRQPAGGMSPQQAAQQAQAFYQQQQQVRQGGPQSAANAFM